MILIMNQIYIFMKRLTNFFRWHWFVLAQISLVFLAFILRFYQFAQTPTSLYWEEAALLYDASSLSGTSRDMHGNFLPILAVESFGDNKPSGYFYALIPFIKIFGTADFVVKLPSLFAGVLIVLGSGFLIKALFSFREKSEKTGQEKDNDFLTDSAIKKTLVLLVMLVTACNPSFIHLAHVGFETHLASAFFLWGVILLLQAIKKTIAFNWRLLVGELLLFCSFYTYHSFRIVAPLLGLYLGIWFFWAQKKSFKKNFFNFFCATVLLLFALLPVFFANQQDLTSRFTDTSIFNNLDLIVASNQCRIDHQNTFLARFYCHRYLYFAGFFGQNILRALNPRALFFVGDGQLRHSPGPWGFFYPFELIFLAGAIFFIIKNYQKNRPIFHFLLFWLFVSLIPTALTYDNPHLLRNLSGFPVWMIFFALGIFQFYISIFPYLQKKSFSVSSSKVTQKNFSDSKNKQFFILWTRFFFFLLVSLYLIFLAVFLQYYGTTYRVTSAEEWQFGYKEAVAALQVLQEKYPQLPFYFTRTYSRPSIYYFLYAHINPIQVQQAKNENMEQSEFLSWDNQRNFFYKFNSQQEQIAVLSPTELASFPQLALTDVTRIYNLQNQLVFLAAKVN